jgi:hypothetical protein
VPCGQGLMAGSDGKANLPERRKFNPQPVATPSSESASMSAERADQKRVSSGSCTWYLLLIAHIGRDERQVVNGFSKFQGVLALDGAETNSGDSRGNLQRVIG